jgi:hypothetical protein
MNAPMIELQGHVGPIWLRADRITAIYTEKGTDESLRTIVQVDDARGGQLFNVLTPAADVVEMLTKALAIAKHAGTATGNLKESKPCQSTH